MSPRKGDKYNNSLEFKIVILFWFVYQHAVSRYKSITNHFLNTWNSADHPALNRTWKNNISDKWEYIIFFFSIYSSAFSSLRPSTHYLF